MTPTASTIRLLIILDGAGASVAVDEIKPGNLLAPPATTRLYEGRSFDTLMALIAAKTLESQGRAGETLPVDVPAWIRHMLGPRV